MSLTKDEVKKVASLAKLSLSPEEELVYNDQLSEIVAYIDHLDKVSVKDVEPTFNIVQSKDITQSENVNNKLTQQESLENAPPTKNGFFVSKGIFNNE